MTPLASGWEDTWHNCYFALVVVVVVVVVIGIDLAYSLFSDIAGKRLGKHMA